MALLRRPHRPPASVVNAVFVGFCFVVTAVALAALALILWSLLAQGVGGLNLKVFTMSTPAAGTPGGLINAIFGSVMMCCLGMGIALIIGVLAGTWLARRSRQTAASAAPCSSSTTCLLSAPSILVRRVRRPSCLVANADPPAPSGLRRLGGLGAVGRCRSPHHRGRAASCSPFPCAESGGRARDALLDRVIQTVISGAPPQATLVSARSGLRTDQRRNRAAAVHRA